MSSPRFSADGKSINVLVTDDRSVYPVRVNPDGGAAVRLMTPPVVVSSWTSEAGCSAVLGGGDARPTEVQAMEGGALRQITHQNDALLAGVADRADRGR